MLYLLNVFLVGMIAGRTAAIMSSFLSFAAFDWFFTEPVHTLQVKSPSEWVTLLVYLVVSTITGQLSAKLKASVAQANKREKETLNLAKASLAISSQLRPEQALNEVLIQLVNLNTVDTAAIITIDSQQNTAIRLARFKQGPLTESESQVLLKKINQIKNRNPRQVNPEENPEVIKQAINSEDIYLSRIGIGEKKSGAIYLKLNNSQLKKNSDNFFDQDDFFEDQSKLKTQNREEPLIKALVNYAGLALQREELIQQQSRSQALADADRLKTALLAMVSHDFRSPLTGIKAAVSALQQESGPLEDKQETLTLLRGIEAETDRLNRMVENILNMSRLEADAWRPVMEASSLEEIIGSALSNFSTEDNNHIIVHLQANLPDIVCDPVQIEQVIKNLVENAIKYTNQVTNKRLKPNEVATLAESSIELEVHFENNAFIITVMDRGCGIKNEEKERIFERFFRGAGLKESAIPGIGIGLAICQALVAAHNGEITATPRSGGGTIFKIVLPV
jgi:two-component system sensor histidine kinase KdpD